ncbi:mitochondrial inner membrane protein required for protein import [Spiromyces aspiralis]|uniref:Mitochondrial inner membrane protein required for protein import n=1 Tax=Spiromyces aspiralis TaxID=68401 RepID=A0ACC1HRB4_9FUNG|nr:mitochondrial inner membrane protein required for protein import [Spiromyces aspiralis]
MHKDSEHPPVGTGASQSGGNKSTAGVKPGVVSPFGFSSAGEGLASKILGNEPGEPESKEQAASSGREQQRNPSLEDIPLGDLPSGANRNAAASRRARRLRANLPPPKDDKRIKHFKIVGAGLIIGLIIGSIGYFGRPLTKEELEKSGIKGSDAESNAEQVSKRYAWRFKNLFKFFNEPVLEKFLPDPNEYTAPYTLVVNLDDTLIHSTWSKEYGWRIAKRPYVDKFLSYMATMYEVVIFTSQPSYSGENIMQKLDPLGFAPFRLYKECMSHVNGKNVKDLSRLNRNLAKVIIMDINPEMYSLQPGNGIQVRPWNGEPEDDWLDRIIPFFEYLHLMSPEDVRPWLNLYRNKDLPTEFAKWEDSVRQKLRQEWEEQQARKRRGIVSWLLGSDKEAEQPPEMQVDQIRRQMRENYRIQHKQIVEMAEKERQEIEEQNKKLWKEMTLWKMIKEGPPAPSADAA